MSLLAGFTGAIAFAARAFETYAFPTRPDWLPNGVAAAGMVLVAALLHGVKVQTGALAQNIVVFLKVAMLIGFLAFAAVRGDDAGHRPRRRRRRRRSRLAAFAGSLVWISLSYSGFNAAVYVAGEAKDAQRNAPKALWVGHADRHGALHRAERGVRLPAAVRGRGRDARTWPPRPRRRSAARRWRWRSGS